LCRPYSAFFVFLIRFTDAKTFFFRFSFALRPTFRTFAAEIKDKKGSIIFPIGKHRFLYGKITFSLWENDVFV